MQFSLNCISAAAIDYSTSRLVVGLFGRLVDKST